jgi:hypothetical protein
MHRSGWGTSPSHIAFRPAPGRWVNGALIARTTLLGPLLSQIYVLVRGAVSGREGHKKADRRCQGRNSLHLPNVD